MLSGCRILLGVTGGIAAYKAAELVRLLRGAGAEVRVVMTPAATAFVTPLTFQALSGNPVHQHLLDGTEESAMGHIRLARWADLILVAPATADFMARLSAGLADDLLATLCLATAAPIVLAPAMNQAMWRNPATQDNAAVLQRRGIQLLGPAAGAQACGETGPGRMLEPVDILAAVAAGILASNTALQAGPSEDRLRGVRILISAGPTREPIDPVRYLSNRSSGKMGYALAEAAVTLGAAVTLVTGPTALPEPPVMEVVRVETAQSMFEAVLSRAGAADIYIGAAAVADYTPEPAPHKIKKAADELTLQLVRTQDILAAVARHEPRPFTVGFAAETQQLETYARGKLADKSLDMVAANRVGEGQGFEVDDNALFVCWPDGECHLPRAPKITLAHQLLNLIADRYHAQHPTQDSR
ncbi:MAG: bifunctional phosphopantothenoylcysteine decarboxylase/phosphopantothenate--cysteine ligase CoaBC [Methylococcus sp.]